MGIALFGPKNSIPDRLGSSRGKLSVSLIILLAHRSVGGDARAKFFDVLFFFSVIC